MLHPKSTAQSCMGRGKTPDFGVVFPQPTRSLWRKNNTLKRGGNNDDDLAFPRTVLAPQRLRDGGSISRRKTLASSVTLPRNSGEFRYSKPSSDLPDGTHFTRRTPPNADERSPSASSVNLYRRICL